MHLPVFLQGKTKERIKRDFFPTQIGKEAVACVEGRKITPQPCLAS